MWIQITPASVPTKAFVIIDVTMVKFNVFIKILHSLFPLVNLLKHTFSWEHRTQDIGLLVLQSKMIESGHRLALN